MAIVKTISTEEQINHSYDHCYVHNASLCKVIIMYIPIGIATVFCRDGDDSLFGVPERYGEPNIKDFVPHYQTLGLTVHPDKGCVATRADELEFLGHCARGAKVDRETASLMRLALYPEHPVLGPAMSINRIKGIMLDSACNSWGITHLYKHMMSRYRREIESDPDNQLGIDKDWLESVLGMKHGPSELNEITVFLLT